MPPLASNHTRRASSPYVLSPPVERASRGSRPVTSSFFVLDEEYYFVDGNVVLVADNVAFRVHKSVLARHSNYFRQLVVQRPVPLEGTDYFDGCLVIRLPDRSFEVSEFLRILYDHV
jgi:BTB/POZ domain